MNALAFTLTTKIQQSRQKFDRLITLAKGGWPMTYTLVDYLNIPEVASIGVKFYEGIGKRKKTPEIYQDLPVSVKGEHVLLFDDIVDTGDSLEFTIDHLRKEGVESITTASLFWKPHATFKPDYFGAETKDWIIFPYDLRDSVQQLGKKWKMQQMSINAIIDRFVSFGFSREYIEYFVALEQL